MDLAAGTWNFKVDMFGFTSVQQQIEVDNKPLTREWTLDMPRLTPSSAKPQALQTLLHHNGQIGHARTAIRIGVAIVPIGVEMEVLRAPNSNATGSAQRPDFQNAQVRAGENSQELLSGAAADAASGDLTGGRPRPVTPKNHCLSTTP